MSTVGFFRNSSEFQNFQAGQPIFEEGQAGDFMWAVQEGEVEIIIKGKVVETIGRGGIFGEMALIDNEPRSATALAKTDCRLVPVNEQRFTYMVHETPFFALQVLRVTVGRLRRSSGQA